MSSFSIKEHNLSIDKLFQFSKDIYDRSQNGINILKKDMDQFHNLFENISKNHSEYSLSNDKKYKESILKIYESVQMMNQSVSKSTGCSLEQAEHHLKSYNNFIDGFLETFEILDLYDESKKKGFKAKKTKNNLLTLSNVNKEAKKGFNKFKQSYELIKQLPKNISRKIIVSTLGLFLDIHLIKDINKKMSLFDQEMKYGTNLVKYSAQTKRIKPIEKIIKQNKDKHLTELFSLDDALYYAATSDFPELAKLLINNGYNINKSKKSLYNLGTPLLTAASNSYGVTELLVENGADIEAVDDFGRTPLYLAIREGNTDIAKLLLDHGASVNPTETTTTLKQNILNTKNIELIQSAVKNCANFIVESNLGYHDLTQMHSNYFLNKLFKNDPQEKPIKAITRYSGDKDPQYIFKHLDILKKDENGLNLIENSIINDNSKFLDYFLSKIENINSQYKNGNTLLHTAVLAQSRKSLLTLMKSNIDIFIKNNDGKNAFDLSKELDYEGVYYTLEEYYKRKENELLKTAVEDQLQNNKKTPKSRL